MKPFHFTLRPADQSSLIAQFLLQMPKIAEISPALAAAARRLHSRLVALPASADLWFEACLILERYAQHHPLAKPAPLRAEFIDKISPPTPLTFTAGVLLPYLEAALACDARHLGAWAKYGEICELLCHYEYAAAAFTEALRLHPRGHAIRSRLAHAQAALGDLFAAIANYRQVWKKQPKNYWAWLNLGIAYASARQIDAAEAAFQKAAALQPKNPIPRQNLAALAKLRNDPSPPPPEPDSDPDYPKTKP